MPFIARYRKEVTGGLDDTQLRTLESRLGYLRELEERRQSILKSIDDQATTPELATAINGTLNKNRKILSAATRGQIAIEAGLEPLAETLWNDASRES